MIFCLAIALTILLNTIVQTRQEHINVGMEQVKLAEQGITYSSSRAPSHYKYRVLVPSLVRLLPFEIKEGFKYVSMLGCFLTLLCLGLILYSLRLDMFRIFAGMILGAFSYTIIYSLNYPYVPDAMNNAIITACFLGLIRRNILLVAIILVLGFLNHDTAIAYLILVPPFFSNNRKLIDKKGLLYFICVGGIILATKIALMSTLGGEGVTNVYARHFTLANIIANWNSKGGIIGAAARVYITFHLLWFFTISGFRDSDWKVKRGWLMIIPAILLFFVLSDTRRHLSYLLPVIVTAGTYYFVSPNKNLKTIFRQCLILAMYVFISLLASRDTVEYFLSFKWPFIIEEHIFAVIGLANLTGIIMIYNKRFRNYLCRDKNNFTN